MPTTNTQPTLVKKKRNKVYFGKDVQNAIIEFNRLGEDNPHECNKLFKSLIYPAFAKLSENIINTWKFHRYETNYTDLQTDTVTALYSKITGYNPEKGRAYSYFTIIAKNFLIQNSMALYKASKITAETEAIDVERNIVTEVSITDYQESLRDFIGLWCEWLERNLEKLFRSKRDRKIADAIIDIFRSSSDLDLNNKKLYYVLIRERSGVDTQHITKVIKTFKRMFKDMFNDYRVNGFIESSKYLS